VAAEAWGDKTIVHNYGHGGGGISLCWGSAALALDLARATQHRRAAVIGCGALGLSSARLLQDAGFDVTIYARDLPPNTTSNIAGAQWTPVGVVDQSGQTPEFEQQIVRASRFAWRYFQNLAGPKYGVWWRENYLVDDEPTDRLAWTVQIIPDILPITTVPAGEHPFVGKHVRRYLSMHIEPAVYLPAVLADFRIAGGKVVVREFPDRPSIAAVSEPLVVNCTGLDAGKLFEDPDVMPVKGQLVVLAPQPEVDYIAIGSGGFYMMPRQDGIILGGTNERGEWSLEPTPDARERILNGHATLFGSML
jgi:glycine/D-amino acid oxidase-like deaminating enzyme